MLDYPDEDIEEFRIRDYEEALRGGLETLELLLNTFERGKTHRMKRYLAKIYQDAMEAKQIQYMRVYELQEQTRAALANPSILS